jgi:glycosyltransferase involved in cell wall biosynthesis
MPDAGRPLVSVLISSYNHARFLGEAIESVLAQTYPRWELVITDDASTDNSAEVLQRYAAAHPGRIRVFRHERNRGVSAAANRGLAEARGEYLAWLGSDDRMHPERLARQVAFLDAHPEVGAVFSRIRYIDPDGHPLEFADDVFSQPIGDLARQLLLKNFLNAPSAMVRRTVADRIGRYNPVLDYTQDYDYWMRLIEHADIRRLSEPLTDYRVHDRNMSLGLATGTRFASHYESVLVILRAIERWPLERLYDFHSAPGSEERIREETQARLWLACHCLELDRAYFRRALLATATAYRLVLDVLDRDPDNAAARGVLKDIYRQLGDVPRAEGRGAVLNRDWQAAGGAPVETERDPAAPAPVATMDERYREWVKRHTLEEIDGVLHAERMMLHWSQRPRFHVIVSGGHLPAVHATLESLRAQLYPGWSVTVLGEGAAPADLDTAGGRIDWRPAPPAPDRLAAVNDVIAAATADWVQLLHAGERLQPHFFLVAGDYLHRRPGWRLIYTDEDRIDADGSRVQPRFKPDFNLDLLRSMPYLGAGLLVQRALLTMIGGVQQPGAPLHDLALRVLDAAGETAIGHVAEVLVHVPLDGAIEPDAAAVRAALADHLARRGIGADIQAGFLPGTFRVIYPLTATPRVSIIVPTRDKLVCLAPCIDSVLEKTRYPDFELIVVDNDSREPETLAWLTDLAARHPQRVKVLRYPYPFNYAAISNLAADAAGGDYLLFLNNDTQVLHEDWLERLVRHGLRPEVGVVGARLVYPGEGRLQHAGVVLGLHGTADHLYLGELFLNDPGYLGRAQVDQNYTAVTGACLLIGATLYRELGGMDAERFKVLFNDVDLCLRVGRAGHKIVWTPSVTLIHQGSASLLEKRADPQIGGEETARNARERLLLQQRWLPQLAHDPAYNRHLGLCWLTSEVEETVVANWDVNFHDRPRVLGNSPSGGSAEYRMLSPLRALSRAGLCQTGTIDTGRIRQSRVLQPVELERLKPDAYLLHAAITDMELEALTLYRRVNRGIEFVMGLDDLVTNLPDKNHFRKEVPKDIDARLRQSLSLSDRLIVTTEPLRELCRGLIDDIRVIPNRLERALWDAAVPRREPGRRPRVGWAGAQQHLGDLLLVRELVEATAREIDWVFLGMCPDELRPHVREVHDFVLNFRDYPAKLASLNLDLAIAPLEIHPFNEAKSNLRLLEYGWMGWPVVCTDILPYQGAPVCRVPNDPARWIAAIRERIHDRDAARREGEQLREWVKRHFVLEDHLDEWYHALVPAALAGTFSAQHSPRRAAAG